MNWSQIRNALGMNKGKKINLHLKIGQTVFVKSSKDTVELYKVRVMSFDKDTVCVLHPRGQSYEFVPNDKNCILLELPKLAVSERMAVA